MSMMNNWWFRVAINPEGDTVRRFEHPTQAGNTSGGWMQRYNEDGRSVRNPQFDAKLIQEATKAGKDAYADSSVPKEKVDVDALMRNEANFNKTISAEDFAEHANERSPWFVVNGHVFNGTEFLEKHPGGAESITLVAGEDATDDFMAIHSIDAKMQMRDFHLGKLAEGAKISEPKEGVEEDPDAPFLHPKHWKQSMLVSRTKISHDSYMFRFAMGAPYQKIGLPIGQHVYLRVRTKSEDNQEAETIQRAYTPFSGNEQPGFLDILIKVYRPCTKFPTGGKMTCALERLEPGKDSIEVKGPLGHFIYEMGSMMQIHKKRRKVRNVAMIAGGSGITPIWSTLKGLVDDPEANETNVWILNANRTEADILARQQIDDLLQRASVRVKLWHTLSCKEVPESWSMGRGRIGIDTLRKHLPPAPQRVDDADGNPVEDTIALLCGPPPMEEATLAGLAELGWDIERNVVRF